MQMKSTALNLARAHAEAYSLIEAEGRRRRGLPPVRDPAATAPPALQRYLLVSVVVACVAICAAIYLGYFSKAPPVSHPCDDAVSNAGETIRCLDVSTAQGVEDLQSLMSGSLPGIFLCTGNSTVSSARRIFLEAHRGLRKNTVSALVNCLATLPSGVPFLQAYSLQRGRGLSWFASLPGLTTPVALESHKGMGVGDLIKKVEALAAAHAVSTAFCGSLTESAEDTLESVTSAYVQAHGRGGSWSVLDASAGGGVLSPKRGVGKAATLELPAMPAASHGYCLTADIVPEQAPADSGLASGTPAAPDALVLGQVLAHGHGRPDTRFGVVLNAGSTTSALELFDGHNSSLLHSAARKHRPLFAWGVRTTIAILVTSHRVVISVDGVNLIDWYGDAEADLTLDTTWKTPRSRLFLGTQGTRYRFLRFVTSPLP